MSQEFYGPNVLQESRRLYDGIRRWAVNNEATIIGGWAVFELVHERIQRQSRDTDIVLHTLDACKAFDELLPALGLVWAKDDHGRRMECHRPDDKKKEILVDVFTPKPFHSFFKWHSGSNLKAAPLGLIAPYEFMLNDKISTTPKRQGRDAPLKKAKDLVDIRDMVFFNRDAVLPKESLRMTDPRARELAAYEHTTALAAAPNFKIELDEARDWLRKS
jgi:hypothetical protein